MNKYTWVCEVDMAPPASGNRLDGVWQGFMDFLTFLKTFHTPVLWVHVQDCETGDSTGNDPQVGIRPYIEPTLYLLFTGKAMLVFLPPL